MPCNCYFTAAKSNWKGQGLLWTSPLWICVTAPILLLLFVWFDFMKFLDIKPKSLNFGDRVFHVRKPRISSQPILSFQVNLNCDESAFFMVVPFPFQLHDHEDVLESGAYTASYIQQDLTDDRKTTRGPIRARAGGLVLNKIQLLISGFAKNCLWVTKHVTLLSKCPQKTPSLRDRGVKDVDTIKLVLLLCGCCPPRRF